MVSLALVSFSCTSSTHGQLQSNSCCTQDCLSTLSYACRSARGHEPVLQASWRTKKSKKRDFPGTGGQGGVVKSLGERIATVQM